MTNNPTIDGVSRDSVLQLFDFLADAKAYHKVVIERCNDCIKSGESSEREEYGRIGFRTQKIAQVERLAEELRALLDAPVVERQPVDDPLSQGFYTTQSGGGHYSINIGFRTLAEMQAADKQLLDVLRDRSEVAALQSTIARYLDRITELESGKGEAQITLKPFRDLPYGAKFRYQGGKEVWVRTQHNVIAEWKDKLTRHDRQSLCCFCYLDGDEDGNTLDTLVEVVE